MITDTIVKIAKGYVGQEEIKDNQGWKDKAFEKKMLNVGWYKGAPWCAFLAKLIWQDAFIIDDKDGLPFVKKYSNGSALDTFHNYAKSAQFHVTKTPTVGDIVIWQEGHGTAGHAGIVVEVVDSNTIHTVEGNTNTNGSREGYIAAIKTRKLNLPVSPTGLNLVGFVQAKRIA